MACTVPHAWHIPCLQIRSKSIHSIWRKQKSLSKHSALELQNIFWGKCCKSTSSLQVITTSGCSNSRLGSFPSHHQGLFRRQWNAQSVLRQHLPCSPRAAVSEAGRYLNSEIMHYSESYNTVFDLALLHKNNSQQLRVFPEHWGMSPPVPRLVRDSCPHETPAATKPASVCNCSSATSTTQPKGFLQWSPLFQFITLQHKLCECPSWLSGIEYLALNNFFQRVLPYRHIISKCCTGAGDTNTSIASITQDNSYIFSEDHNLY